MNLLNLLKLLSIAQENNQYLEHLLIYSGPAIKIGQEAFLFFETLKTDNDQQIVDKCNVLKENILNLISNVTKDISNKEPAFNEAFENLKTDKLFCQNVSEFSKTVKNNLNSESIASFLELLFADGGVMDSFNSNESRKDGVHLDEL
jgi:hypothetical protein